MTEGYQPLTTLVGTVSGRDPELRFTATGLPVCNFSLRVPEVRAKEASDGKPAVKGVASYFVEVAAWRELGENVAESLVQGDRVIVRGPAPKEESYAKHDGEVVTKLKMSAWNVGVDLSYATAEVVKSERKTERTPAPVSSGAPLESF